MRMLMLARMPHEEFNAAVRDSTVGQKINRILETTKPEAAWFCELDGRRTAVMIVNLKDQSEVPAYAEPWFLTFKADVQFRIAMTPQDLAKAGLDQLGSQWA